MKSKSKNISEKPTSSKDQPAPTAAAPSAKPVRDAEFRKYVKLGKPKDFGLIIFGPQPSRKPEDGK